ncbi:MAG: putative metal-binding motif-containing protein [Deltaproteobacteria bacterium]|nr:putative metal-binding motif-containing protein [Deltaproteobacteria bacterium]
MGKRSRSSVSPSYRAGAIGKATGLCLCACVGAVALIATATSCLSKIEFMDADADDYAYGDVPEEQRDCDDSNPNVHPGALEIPGNKIDDNCNDEIDEPTDNNDWDQDGVPKKDGEKELDCDDQNASIHSASADGGVSPARDVCNGKDDDCDKELDEDDPAEGAACGDAIHDGKPLKGECAKGVLHCKDGEIECEQTVYPQPEIFCNDSDEDCDGISDKDDKPPVEVCDGVDNDCDKNADEPPACNVDVCFGTIPLYPLMSLTPWGAQRGAMGADPEHGFRRLAEESGVQVQREVSWRDGRGCGSGAVRNKAVAPQPSAGGLLYGRHR